MGVLEACITLAGPFIHALVVIVRQGSAFLRKKAALRYKVDWEVTNTGCTKRCTRLRVCLQLVLVHCTTTAILAVCQTAFSQRLCPAGDAEGSWTTWSVSTAHMQNKETELKKL